MNGDAATATKAAVHAMKPSSATFGGVAVTIMLMGNFARPNTSAHAAGEVQKEKSIGHVMHFNSSFQELA